MRIEMRGISPHSLLKQLPLKDIIRDYFEKKESWNKILKMKENGNLANSCENGTICITIK